MPAEYLWPFMPLLQTRGPGEGKREKVTYICAGCGAKVWGKAGLGIVCQCSETFVADGEEARPELSEQVYRLLAEKHGETNPAQAML